MFIVASGSKWPTLAGQLNIMEIKKNKSYLEHTKKYSVRKNMTPKGVITEIAQNLIFSKQIFTEWSIYL